MFWTVLIEALEALDLFIMIWYHHHHLSALSPDKGISLILDHF